MPCFARIAKDRRKHNVPPEDEVSVYLYSVLNVRYVAAEEMSVVHRKHIQPTSQRFHVPLDCKGWFEVLSQDGISARPYGSVGELAKLGSSTRCVVRQSVGGYVRKADGYDSQIVRKGDVLTLHETMWISARSGGGTFNKQLLRCVDQRSQEVYLDTNLRGLFSPVAGQTSVTGAHTIQSLLTKFRLPVMVRLLYGNIHQPAGSTYSTGVFKLMNVFSDEILFALPLGAKTDDRILSISTRAKSLKLKSLQKSRNDAVQNLRRQCRAMVARHLDTVLSVTALYESAPLLAGVEFEPLASDEKKDHVKSSKQRSSSTPASPEEEQLFREIEDIYNSIGCNPDLVPRPIIFTTETAGGGGKGLRRNVTAVPKVKTVQYRMSTAAQRSRIVDDNWQMLPRQMTCSAVQLHGVTSDHTNILTNDVQVQTTPKPERGKRKPIPNTVALSKNKEARHGEHLYEEIPYFSRTKMDVSSMDIQKTVYISDTSLSRPDTLHDDVFDNDNGLRSPDKEKERVDHSLPRPVTSHADYLDGRDASLTIRTHLARPKSYAGTPFFDGLALVDADLRNSLENPPPLPPKRGESMCNLRDELSCVHSSTTFENTIEPTKTPSPTPTRDTSTDPQLAVDPVPDTLSPRAGDRRTPSKASQAVKTLGNVSRSFLNKIRLFGNRSSATLVINSTDDDSKPVNGDGSCLESAPKSSTGSSPEPPTLSEKMATKEPSLSITPDSAPLTF